MTQTHKNFDVIKSILETARWTPSPDNLQSWRFKLITEEHFQVHYKDESDWMVYDINGHATWLTLGFLIECIEISALHYGYSVNFSEYETEDAQLSIFDFYIKKITIEPEPIDQASLFEFIETRSVQRNPMSTQKLTTLDKSTLESAIPHDFSIRWLETLPEKLSVGKLLYGSSSTRYSMKEGYDVHSKVIDWRKGYEQYSPTKIPPNALGVDPITVALTKWALASWKRFYILDKYFAGTLWAKFLMDFLTSVRCGGHFLLTKNVTAVTKADFIQSGQVCMRLWLTFQKLGYCFQPEHTPVMFSELVRNNTHFSDDTRASSNAIKMDKYFKKIVGIENVNCSVYLARYGKSALPMSRSVRKELNDLIIN